MDNHIARIISEIVDALTYAELAKDPQGIIKARRLLNNDLRQAIDADIQEAIEAALAKKPEG